MTETNSGKIDIFKRVKLSPSIRGKRGVPVIFDSTVGQVLGFFRTKNDEVLYTIMFGEKVITLPEEYLVEVVK